MGMRKRHSMEETIGSFRKDRGGRLKVKEKVKVNSPMADNPFPEHVPYHGLASGPNDQRFLQFRGRIDHELALLPVRVGCETMVSHDGALLGESVDVLCLLTQERLRDEEGEVSVLGAVTLDPGVQVGSYRIP